MPAQFLPTRLLSSAWLSSRMLLTRVSTGMGRSRSYAEAIRVGKPGRCPETPVLSIFIFDNSGSVTGGNDPIGQRFLEAYIAITRIGNRCRCGRDMTATIHFDTPTSRDLKPTRITRDHHGDIAESLAIPADGAGISLLEASLAKAREIALRHSHSHRIVLLTLTDFELFDECLDQLIAFPGDVHAAVLRLDPPAKLLDAPSVTVTRIGHDSKPGLLARAAFTAMTKTRPRANPLPVAELAGPAVRAAAAA